MQRAGLGSRSRLRVALAGTQITGLGPYHRLLEHEAVGIMCWHRVRALQMWSETCGSSLGIILPSPVQCLWGGGVGIRTLKHVFRKTNIET